MNLKIDTITEHIPEDAFGYSLALGDINGDGKNEIIVASTNGPKGATIKVFSPNKKRLKTFHIGNKKVNTIRLITADINQDQIDELVVGITYQDLSGEVKVFSVKDHRTIYHWKSEREYDAFGFTIAVGHITGDEGIDVLVGAPQPIQRGKGKVYIYNGKDGSLFREYTSRISKEYCDFATSVAAGDIDGDGFDEVIIGAPGVPRGEVYVYSGRLGWLTQKLSGDPGFGINVHVDDVNGDERKELLVTTKDLHGNKVSVFQGGFYPIYEIMNDEVDIGFGETMITSDINGDGKKEIILGAFDAHHKRKKYAGQVNVYSGDEGKLLHRWYGQNEKDQFGFSMAAGKLDNAKDSLLIGVPREILKKNGLVYIVSME
ncbi:FG-GAP-like repeat-containing protein [Tepidibacillus infernus]|uniref:FG-GAP-like repeat-containing protein n=1 Tax=Tepidibacillus TaxID=1494427 RepID=UPI000853D0E4|nr:FG-GAP-like repeat-containing protein [Tepidibacillus sp. HK-1]GBF11243.1 FG-GAP repeat protein [Tepidibacillus sp. HK-1]